jgi:aryl-alcohol dehydrogenase-like predicted oxidoreductase
MKTRPLGKTGLDVSVLGYGASPLGGVFGEVDAAEGIRAVHRAIDLGINLFDVAPYYGLTRAEIALGNGLSGIPRDKFVLATKVGRYGGAEFDFSASRVLRSIEESLKRLQVQTIDIITCHDIEFVSIRQVIEEAIPALHRAREQGKVRFIGVSGLPLSVYHTVLDRVPLDTILSYCHHALNDNSLVDHLPYFETKGVGVINASPFSMGLLTGFDPPEWHPAGEAIRTACRRAAEHCKSRGVEIGKLALQYSISNPGIATTLAGMRSQREVEQNVAWLQAPPDRQLLAEVLEILAPVHNQTWQTGLPENN